MFQDEMHNHYTDLGQHWHAMSEEFTGADRLLTILKTGGEIIDGNVYYEYFPLSQHRRVRVFHIYVQHYSETKHMKIVDTPYLHRLFRIMQISIFHLDSRLILSEE